MLVFLGEGAASARRMVGGPQTVADGGNHFALDLYGKLAEKEKGNVFFSPYSVHTALAMTAVRRGGTRASRW